MVCNVKHITVSSVVLEKAEAEQKIYTQGK